MYKRTTIHLGDEDRVAITEIKHKYGLASDSDAIRLALRLIARSARRKVVFEVRKNQRKIGEK